MLSHGAGVSASAVPAGQSPAEVARAAGGPGDSGLASAGRVPLALAWRRTNAAAAPEQGATPPGPVVDSAGVHMGDRDRADSQPCRRAKHPPDRFSGSGSPPCHGPDRHAAGRSAPGVARRGGVPRARGARTNPGGADGQTRDVVSVDIAHHDGLVGAGHRWQRQPEKQEERDPGEDADQTGCRFIGHVRITPNKFGLGSQNRRFVALLEQRIAARDAPCHPPVAHGRGGERQQPLPRGSQRARAGFTFRACRGRTGRQVRSGPALDDRRCPDDPPSTTTGSRRRGPCGRGVGERGRGGGLSPSWCRVHDGVAR